MSRSTVVTTRVDPSLSEALDALAARHERSRAWLVARAVERYVEEEAAFLAFVAAGEESIAAGEVFTQAQMEDWVASRVGATS